MFKEIAGKDNFCGIIRHGTHLTGTIQDNIYAWRGIAFDVGIDIYGSFMSGLNIVDEFTISSTNLQYPAVAINVALKKVAAQNFPHLVAELYVRSKAPGINSLDI